jgi:restriction endonuclease
MKIKGTTLQVENLHKSEIIWIFWKIFHIVNLMKRRKKMTKAKQEVMQSTKSEKKKVIVSCPTKDRMEILKDLARSNRLIIEAMQPVRVEISNNNFFTADDKNPPTPTINICIDELGYETRVFDV